MVLYNAFFTILQYSLVYYQATTWKIRCATAGDLLLVAAAGEFADDMDTYALHCQALLAEEFCNMCPRAQVDRLGASL